MVLRIRHRYNKANTTQYAHCNAARVVYKIDNQIKTVSSNQDLKLKT